MLDLKPRPTIVMIAHRDQSLAYCDRLLRLQNGSAVAEEPADRLAVRRGCDLAIARQHLHF
jgi:ABC-type transport system involved in cytochrome bd biosynthesis fused ATPase/permease subunit